MSLPANLVTIHPYFQVQSGKESDFHAVIAQFVERTAPEEGCSFYEFTSSGDIFFCREGYAGAAAALVHLGNVGDIVQKALEISTLIRFELHGPAEELEIMKPHVAGLNPSYYATEGGFVR